MAAETVRIEIPIEVVDEIEPELSNIQKKLTKFDKTAEKTQRSLNKWMKEKYEVYLEAKERVTPILRTLGGGLGRLTRRTWHVAIKAKDFATAPLRGVINLLKNPLFQVGAVLGVSIGMKDTIDTYKNFEAAMSQVSAVSGATGFELDKLTQKAKEMGASTKFTAKETAEGFNYMAMAGWKTQDMLDGIDGILSLAAASGEDLATTSDIVTDALTAFGMQAKDSTHFADVLAQASSNANTNVSMLGESFKYVAPVAGAMKYSVEDVSLALGLMANASVKGSMAGTSLKTAIANMSAPTKKMKSAMDKYKISLTDGKGQMKSFKEVLDNIRGSLGKLSEAEQTAAATRIFGKEAMSGMLAIVNASEKDYNKLTKAINNADGAAADMSATMLNNLEGSITILNSALDGVKLSFGERLSPYVQGIAEWLTDQMPDIEQTLEELMDSVDRKVGRMKAKFDELTETDKWQNADFFGKVKIAWDEFIAEPFADWWNTTGKLRFAEVAQDIGSGIGSGLKFGIMTLLGIDLGDTTNEAVSVGASFAKGFAEGFDFDTVSSKLWNGFKNILRNASKLLPGGESADLSSWLSMALLMKLGSPLLSMGKGTFSIGKALFGKSSAGTSLIGSILGTTGNQMVQGKGLLNLLANAGYSLTGGASSAGGYFGAGTAMSGGAAAAVGAAGVAGTVAAGASLISGAMDFYKAAKSEDKAESDVYTSSGKWKAGGAVAGGVTGVVIGSAVPVIGTALGAIVGAGVGGVAGWIKGNKSKEKYQESLKEAAEKAQKVYQATGMDIDKVKFKSEELTKAMNDTEVSTEEFAAKFQEAVADNLSSHFGDIKMSLKEIQEVASDIVFDKKKEDIDKFTEAVQKSEDSLLSLQSTTRELQKMNWELGISTKLSSSDKENYREMIDNFVENAKTYLKNQHYEATVALELLIGDDSEKLTKGMNSMYSKFQKRINKYNKKLDAKVDIALNDGVIDSDEQKIITELQEKITNITNKVTSAQEKSSFASLKIKHNGAALSPDSFASMQEELQNNVNSMSGSYDNALEISLTNLQLQLDEGAIDQKTYDKFYKELEEKYNKQITKLQGRAQDFQLDAITDIYKNELDNILPDLEGDVSERLKEAMNKALAIEPDAAKWESGDIVKWFGLENIDTETQTAISGLLKETAKTVPDSIANSLHKSYQENMHESYDKILGDKAFESQFETAGTSYGNSLTSGVSDAIAGGSSAWRISAQSALNTAFANPFSVTANVNVNTKYNTGAPFNVPNVSSGSSSDNTPSPRATPRPKTSSGGNSTNLPVAGPSPSPKYNAAGGYAANKQLSWLAEEGYGEYIIPTNPSRRGRALELYEQAGRALGVGQHAAGGFVGRDYTTANLGSYARENETALNFIKENRNNASVGRNEATETYYPEDTPNYSSGNVENENSKAVSPNVNVTVQVNPEFNINASEGQSEEHVIAVIKRHISEIADEVGGEIADVLREMFSNTPLKGA